jgi:hypothetical protein
VCRFIDVILEWKISQIYTHNRTFTVIQHFRVHNFIRYQNILRTFMVTMTFFVNFKSLLILISCKLFPNKIFWRFCYFSYICKKKILYYILISYIFPKLWWKSWIFNFEWKVQDINAINTSIIFSWCSNISSCDFSIVEFSKALNSHDWLSFVVHVHF